ncbi:MAG: DUF1624 domain-containing protein [Oscillospiraceae bacterium]|jgi:uncharacterized membrane protein|nr:DUF1624 domain-containing protein [Oscillospiraceae bacterium]
MGETAQRERIELIDFLRGLSVVLMVCHHALYDAVEFLGAPAWFFSNPIFNLLHYVFAGLFILLSGVSSRFSHSNVKRGIKTLAVALVITLVTWYMGYIVRFGVLHLLGFSMLLYGLTRKVWERGETFATGLFRVLLIVASALAVKYVALPTDAFWMFGWYGADFASSDYFPIFPWVFVFLLGAWAGRYVLERRLPTWFYAMKPTALSRVGRRSLVIYVLHQPVLYGVTMVVARLAKK